MDDISANISTDGCVAVWDARDLSCGPLLIELRKRMRDIQPGERLHLTASDASVLYDILAWSRMTGHRLIAKTPPHYIIERKEE